MHCFYTTHTFLSALKLLELELIKMPPSTMSIFIRTFEWIFLVWPKKALCTKNYQSENPRMTNWYFAPYKQFVTADFKTLEREKIKLNPRTNFKIQFYFILFFFYTDFSFVKTIMVKYYTNNEFWQFSFDNFCKKRKKIFNLSFLSTIFYFLTPCK